MTNQINPDGYSIKGCSIIYHPAGQAGEYAPLAANPYRGCGHGCVYCLSPDTLVQMADGTARQISDVIIGDEVIGISKREQTRRAWNYTFSNSKVLNTINSVKTAYQITLDNGMTAVCSDDHRWLTERGWKFTKRLNSDRYAFLVQTSNPRFRV